MKTEQSPSHVDVGEQKVFGDWVICCAEYEGKYHPYYGNVVTHDTQWAKPDGISQDYCDAAFRVLIGNLDRAAGENAVVHRPPRQGD